MTIKKLSQKDMNDIHRLDERFGTPWSNELYSERIQRFSDLSYGAYENGKLIGFVLAKRLPDGDLYISRVVVDKQYEGKGIAKRLMMKIDKKHGKRIKSTVRESNTRSINLHKSDGYFTLKDDFYTFKDGERGLKMMKYLR